MSESLMCCFNYIKIHLVLLYLKIERRSQCALYEPMFSIDFFYLLENTINS